MSEIKIINAKKIYHDVPVIENLNVTIPKGGLFTILGPSGCGKTTLLRMIAGFNSIEGGELYFDDTKSIIWNLANAISEWFSKTTLFPTF